jgi:hypothetical protein
MPRPALRHKPEAAPIRIAWSFVVLLIHFWLFRLIHFDLHQNKVDPRFVADYSAVRLFVAHDAFSNGCAVGGRSSNRKLVVREPKIAETRWVMAVP